MKLSLRKGVTAQAFVSIFLTLACVLYSINSFAQASNYILQAIPLLPADARFVEISANTTLGNRIDQATLRIFSSPTGKKFCGAVINDYQTFKNSFFLNTSYAKKAFILCKGHFATKRIFRLFPKKYFLALSESNNFIADGWTTPRNETFLFIAKSEFTDDRLTRTLIHELAISLDGKEQIGFLGILDSTNLNIQLDDQSCNSIPLIRDGQIKHTLSTLRAFDVERQISNELKIPLPTGFADWKKISCEDKMIFMSSYVEKFSIKAEGFVNSSIDKAKCANTLSYPDTMSMHEKIKTLSETIFTFSDGSKQNACDYLSSGLPFFPGVSLRGGPGPRIGGGGWSKIEGRVND